MRSGKRRSSRWARHCRAPCRARAHQPRGAAVGQPPGPGSYQTSGGPSGPAGAAVSNCSSHCTWVGACGAATGAAGPSHSRTICRDMGAPERSAIFVRASRAGHPPERPPPIRCGAATTALRRRARRRRSPPLAAPPTMETLAHAALLATAAFGAGALNAVAGGGSFLTFPALVLTGVPPIVANATSALAVSPGYLGSTMGFKAELRELPAQRLRREMLIAAVGGVAGALLLLVTPAKLFTGIVPWLLLFATVL